MIAITFSDRATEKRALAFLLGRFSGCVMKSGEHLVPEAALEALAGQNIPFIANAARPAAGDPHPLRGSVLKYERPFEPVAEDDCNAGGAR